MNRNIFHIILFMAVIVVGAIGIFQESANAVPPDYWLCEYRCADYDCNWKQRPHIDCYWNCPGYGWTDCNVYLCDMHETCPA